MDALEKYVHEFSEPEEELLHELDRETNLRAVAPRMLSGHIQGRLLEMLVRMMRPRRVLEIGTFTGYSALSMAAGLDEGAELHTVEVDDEQEEFIRSYFARSPHGDKITLHIGSALEIAPKLGGEFDMVFIDGDSCSVVVRAEKLTARESLMIMELVTGKTALSAKNVQISAVQG